MLKKVGKMKRSLFLMVVGCLISEPDIGPAQETLLMGSAYKRANGTTLQTKTFYAVEHTTPTGVSGTVGHLEHMASFNMNFLADCPNSIFRFVGKVEQSAPYDINNGVGITVYPEWTLYQFTDGTEARNGSAETPRSRTLPDVQELASARYKKFIEDGEPAEQQVEATTNWIISRHTHRLSFIAEGIFARHC